MEEVIINNEKRKAFLAPDVIMTMLVGNESRILNQTEIQLVTSDFAFYEAISSLVKDEISYSVLSDFFLKVQFVPSPKIMITMDRIKQLRKRAKLKFNIDRSEDES